MAFEIEGKHLLGIIILLGIGVLAYNANIGGFQDTIDKVTSQEQVNQQVNQETDQATSPTTGQEGTETTEATNQGTKEAGIQYQLSNVYRYVKDKANPDTGISGAEVEVLNIPQKPYARPDLFEKASDPNRNTVDQCTSTDSAGKANFTASTIFTNRPYIYSLRGDTDVYDKVMVNTIPWEAKGYKMDTFNFPQEDNIMAYKVGSWTTINSPSTIDAGTTDKMNVSLQSGLTFYSTDITIEQSDSGKFLKDPALVLRSTVGQELEPGDVSALYITRKTGTSFDIPGQDLSEFVDTKAIELGGSVFDETENVYYMSVADSGTYTVKMTYDADNIEVDGDQLEIVLEDLGGYRNKDDVTKNVKASDETLTFDWQ